jgi:hypothetical protein
LLQLKENAAGGARVQEAYEAVQAAARLLVDELDAQLLETGHLGLDVIRPKGDVMDAIAAALPKASQGAISRGRLQKLDLDISQAEDSRP